MKVKITTRRAVAFLTHRMGRKQNVSPSRLLGRSLMAESGSELSSRPISSAGSRPLLRMPPGHVRFWRKPDTEQDCSRRSPKLWREGRPLGPRALPSVHRLGLPRPPGHLSARLSAPPGEGSVPALRIPWLDTCRPFLKAQTSSFCPEGQSRAGARPG